MFQAPLVLAAIGQGGTFDFQRDPAQGLFYHAYKSAANYAVGVYVAGAGYSLADTFQLAQAYALFNSSNYGDPKPRNWITRGWQCRFWPVEEESYKTVKVRRYSVAARSATCAAVIIFGLVAVYVIQHQAFIFYVAWLLHTRDMMDASAKNSRGDEVIARTSVDAGPDGQSETIIRLSRARHLFSSRLLEVHSDDFLVGLTWLDDTTLELQLDFGCDAQMSTPLETIGLIHIRYVFGDTGPHRSPGYESFRRRDIPHEPC